jgi:ribosomal protein S18 acetylase RimI-like enzyme
MEGEEIPKIKDNLIENSSRKEEGKMVETQVLSGYSENSLKGILEVVKNENVPESLRYEDAAEYYKEMLENKENINIVLKDGQRVVGYTFMKPHNKAFDELKDLDINMKPDPERYYLEFMAINPEYKGSGGFRELVNGLVKEVHKRRLDKFSMHARIKNHLAEMVMAQFKNFVTESRTIENWPYYSDGEATQYIEIKLPSTF